MQSLDHVIEESIASHSLPSDGEEFLKQFLDVRDQTVFPQEGELLDYKEEWPFSFSDDYFGGIVRLICAFNNSHGGLIIFGVHDKRRTVCHNRVKANIEQLNNFLRVHLREAVECKIRVLKTDAENRTTIALLVPRRSRVGVPNCCKKKIGKYEAEKYWIRAAHEVVEATSRDLATLFGVNRLNEEAQSSSGAVLSVLPPGAASIKTFVGRVPSLVQLVRWLTEEDEPRKFLYGRGGSGKTTIAYEFAKFVSINGAVIRNQSGQPIQQVIFLTAKEQKLDTKSGRIVADHALDFSDENELYVAILELTGWTADQNTANLTTAELRQHVKELLDAFTTLLVIDDIDTLTTKGKEAGFEFLFKTLSRTNSGSKVLYTMRNAPTQSLENTIEVPGLGLHDEYPAFVSACCSQFKVVEPNEAIRLGKMATASERRPLIVESIVGLRRTTDTYERALELFAQKGGDDIRKYVFQREWQSLPNDNCARHLLLALALLDRPTEFEDLLGILQFSEDMLRDAISEVREMFIELGRETKTLYSVAPLAKGFVLSESLGLNKFAAVKSRVEFFRKSYYPPNPMVTRLELKVDRFIRSVDLDEAWKCVSDVRLPEAIRQDPRFRALLCKVAYKQRPAKISDARECLDFCKSMKFEPSIETMRISFDSEKSSGIGYEKCFSICDWVIGGKSYTVDQKGEFLSRKAHVHYLFATESLGTNSIDAFPHLRSSVYCNFRALFIDMHGEGSKVSLTERNIRSGAYRLIQGASNLSAHDEFVTLFAELPGDCDMYIDPILEPLRDFIYRVKSSSLPVGAKGKFLNKLAGVTRAAAKSQGLFHDKDNRSLFEKVISEAVQ